MVFLPVHEPQRVFASRILTPAYVNPYKCASSATFLGNVAFASFRILSTSSAVSLGRACKVACFLSNDERCCSTMCLTKDNEAP